MLEWVLAAAATLSCSQPAPAIVAHRGGMDSPHPENSLPAFRHAAAAGADAIELDLRATRDGRVVVLHDPRVNRTTDGRGHVHRLSASRVRQLDLGGGTRIPTLTEVFSSAGALEVELLLDLKPAPGLTLEDVVAEAARHQRLDRVIFGVRSLDDHQRLSRVDPELRFLGFVPRLGQVDAFLEAGMEIIRVWPGWLARRPALVEKIHRAGARVWVTAGSASPDELNRLSALGVDGFLTDRPADAVTVKRCEAA